MGTTHCRLHPSIPCRRRRGSAVSRRRRRSSQSTGPSTSTGDRIPDPGGRRALRLPPTTSTNTSPQSPPCWTGCRQDQSPPMWMLVEKTSSSTRKVGVLLFCHFYHLSNINRHYLGVYYSPRECTNYRNETVPEECQEDNTGYTCLGDCKEKLPLHCDRNDLTYHLVC